MIVRYFIYVFFISLTIGLFSCAGTKKTVKKQSTAANAKSPKNANNEYNAFFEAETARIKGDHAKARELYRDFVKTYTNNAAAYYNLAKLEYTSFQFLNAENYAQRAVELQPKNKYYLEFYADVLSANKKQKKAVEIYENLTKLNKGNSAEYEYKKYKIYADQQDFKNAIQTLNQLEESWGRSPELSLQKVELFLKQKNSEAAIAELKELIKDEPMDYSYKEKLARLYEDLGKQQEAKTIYEQLAKDAPNDAKVLMRTSSYYLRNNDTTAFENVIKSIVKNPNIDASIRMSMLLPLLDLKSDSEYVASEILPLMQTLKVANAEPKTLLMMSDVLYSAKQYREAATTYKEYIALEKSTFSAWFNLLLCYSQLNELDSLIASAEKSCDYFPNNALTHYFKGLAHYQKKEYEKSITSLQSAIDLEPEKELKAQIYSLMGDAFFSLKQYQKSDEHFDKSLAISEDAGTLNNYAYYLSLRGDRLDAALKMSARSLELAPESKTFLDTYGWILYKQGKYDKAKEYIERAIEGDGDADVLEHLGDIYYKLQNPTKAIELWKKAKQVGGGGSALLDKKIAEGKLYE